MHSWLKWTWMILMCLQLLCWKWLALISACVIVSWGPLWRNYTLYLPSQMDENFSHIANEERLVEVKKSTAYLCLYSSTLCRVCGKRSRPFSDYLSVIIIPTSCIYNLHFKVEKINFEELIYMNKLSYLTLSAMFITSWETCYLLIDFLLCLFIGPIVQTNKNNIQNYPKGKV